MFQFIISIFVVFSGIFTLYSREQDLRIPLYIFKPLTMILILLIAMKNGQPDPSHYSWLIIGGLVFCLIGDIFLMLPSDCFVAGLISFLIGHIVYISAFTIGKEFSLTLWLLIPFMIYGALMYRILFPTLHEMKIPVFVYTVVIVVMAWQAWERWYVFRENPALYASVGAVFFLASDSVLAFNRFRKEFRHAHVFILSTYFLAQWMIALSVG